MVLGTLAHRQRRRRRTIDASGRGHRYEKDGALWFRSTDYGDEKDRVLVRDNGQTTYFASDIAYHMDKLERGYARVIDIWGADHHGYVPRVKAALAASVTIPPGSTCCWCSSRFCTAAARRRRCRRAPANSSRCANCATKSATTPARFFYVMRKCEQHMDFDLDLAKSQSTDNPVYYIQYAHARVKACSGRWRRRAFPGTRARHRHPRRLTSRTNRLDGHLSRYPEVIESAANNHEPHQIAHYLRELANDFHTYYNAHQFLVEDSVLRNARLTLIQATRQVLANGWGLLGVSGAG